MSNRHMVVIPILLALGLWVQTYAVHAAVSYRITDLGTLGGTANYSNAYAINDLGQIVGYSAVGAVGAASSSSWRPFLWQNGTMTNLTPSDTGWGGAARAINNAGQVVGWSDSFAGHDTRAFLWEAGNATNLGTLPSPYTLDSVATGINEQGQISGYSGGGGSGPRPFVWQNGSFQELANPAWESPVEHGYAYAINDNGVVAGKV